MTIPSSSQNKLISNRYCYYAEASKQIIGVFTPTVWTIWGIVYALLPTVAEVVIAVVVSKLRATGSPNLPINTQPTDPPTTVVPVAIAMSEIGPGNNFLLTMASGLRSPRFESASARLSTLMGWAPTPVPTATTASTGSSNDTLSLGVIAILNMVFFISQKFFEAECAYENQ